MSASPKLHVERVEDRTVPAAFCLPWLASNVTVSFVPDGTSVDGVKSALHAAFSASGLTPAQWQGEMLRAFQTWSAVSNLNFGLVGDGGQAVGTAGRLQADTRFGDIRVSARPLDQSVLAITTPPGYTSETRAGDIVLNSNFQFSTGSNKTGKYDLYTVMLQEVGHAIGLDNSADLTSVMSSLYAGKKTALAATDLTAVQQLYGGRLADKFEGTTPTLAAAPGTTTLYARGDVSSAADSDTFAFTTPAVIPNGVKVMLTTAGLSLLAGRVEVLDANGRVVATSGKAASGKNHELTLTGLAANSHYRVRVSSPSGTNFRSGAYDLRVVFDPTAADPAAAASPAVAVDGLKNETFATATPLAKVNGANAQALYRTYGQIESWSDVDMYRVSAPATATGTTTLTVQVASYKAGQNTGGLAAQAEVYDAAGKLVATEELTYTHSRQTYQARNVPAGADYFVVVKQNTFFSDRDYELTAYFADAQVNYAVTDTRVLSAQQSVSFGTLRVNQTQVFTFQMSSRAVSGYSTGVYLEVFDASGVKVHSVLGSPEVEFGTAVLLTTGEYTVRMRAASPLASTAAVEVILRMDTLTDPIGLDAPADPTLSPDPLRSAPPPSTFSWMTYAQSYYAWLL